MKQGTKTKQVDELKKLQKQIENKERDLKQREQILSSKQKECIISQLILSSLKKKTL